MHPPHTGNNPFFYTPPMQAPNMLSRSGKNVLNLL